MSLHRLAVAGLAALCLLGGSALGGACAWAGTGYGFTQSFGPGGPDSGEFAQIQSVAIDQLTEDVYVYDQGQGGRVYKFNSAGEPQDFSGSATNVIVGVGASGHDETEIAVSSAGPAAGDIYVARGEADARTIGIYSSETGEPLGTLSGEGAPGYGGEPCGVAVDPAGHLYVSIASGFVDKYTPTANPPVNADYTSSLSGVNLPPPPGSQGENCNIAVDGEGNVYVDTYATGPVTMYAAAQFNTTGTAASGSLVDGGGSTLAVDPLNNDLYVDERNQIALFSSALSGNQTVGAFAGSGPGALGAQSYGVAVNGTVGKGASGDMYTSDAAGRTVEIFEPGQAPPVPKTSPPSNVTGTSAVFHGELNPEGVAGGVGFFFSYEEGSTCTGAGVLKTPLDNGSGNAMGSSGVEESSTASELVPATQYAFCFLAEDRFGTSGPGNTELFETRSAPPRVASESAESIGQTEATLNARINPDNEVTHYYFQYALSEAELLNNPTNAPSPPGNELPKVYLPAGEATLPQQLSGLKANTTYYFRVLAGNAGGGSSEGVPVESFLTLPANPTTGPASNVTQTTATLTGSFDPGGHDTRYYFQYGTDTNYRLGSTPILDAGEGTSTVEPAVEAKALQPNTTYHYRLVIFNATGSSYGPDAVLTTPAILPGLSTSVPVSIASDTATVGSEILAQGADTRYRVEYGPSEAFGASTPQIDAGSAIAGQWVTAALEGLQPTTRYYYRFVASNSGGEEHGETATFTTAATTEPSSGPLPPDFSLTGTAQPGAAVTAFPNLAGLAPTPPSPAHTGASQRPSTSAQKLAKALKACKRNRSSRKRTACEKHARHTYSLPKKK